MTTPNIPACPVCGAPGIDNGDTVSCFTPGCVTLARATWYRLAQAATLLEAVQELQEHESVVIGLTWNGRNDVDTEIRPPYADSLIALAAEVRE